jgi:hypothetical protein
VWQIEATIANAKAVQALEKEGQSLADLLWSFQPKGSPTKPPASMSDIPTKTPEVACHFFFLGLLEIYSLAFAPVRTLSLSLFAYRHLARILFCFRFWRLFTVRMI